MFEGGREGSQYTTDLYEPLLCSSNIVEYNSMSTWNMTRPNEFKKERISSDHRQSKPIIRGRRMEIDSLSKQTEIRDLFRPRAPSSQQSIRFTSKVGKLRWLYAGGRAAERGRTLLSHFAGVGGGICLWRWRLANIKEDDVYLCPSTASSFIGAIKSSLTSLRLSIRPSVRREGRSFIIVRFVCDIISAINIVELNALLRIQLDPIWVS